MIKIQLLHSAVEDLDLGRRFYDQQSEGLGAQFLDSLFSEIDSLARYGGIHKQVFGYHRLLAQQFPFAIYYKTDEESGVLVYRVLDLRQSPHSVRKALL
jgi:plasmid stabilization system protein ParE